MATAVAIAVSSSKSKSCQRAVQWAISNTDIHQSNHFILIHVMPCITTIPTPSGKLVSVMDMEEDVVTLYRQDMISKCEEIFVLFKRMCKNMSVETVLLEDDSPANAIVRYVRESGCTSLVLGYTSSSYITRKLMGPSIPSTVLKSAPNTCDVYLIAKNKLLTRAASSPSVAGPVNTAVPGILPQEEKSKGIDSPQALHSGSLELKSTESLQRSSESLRDYSIRSSYVESKSSESLQGSPRSLGDFSLREYSFPEDDKQADLQGELEQMQLELRNTLELYDQACGDLVHVQKKVESLSFECLEEAKKTKDVLLREEILRNVAAEEKAKHLEVIKEVEETKQVLEKEANERQKAEMAAFVESWKKQEVLDTLLTTDKRYRKYSKDEIESATDLFSDAKVIGEGGYGKVYKGTLDHTPVAIKIIHADSTDRKHEFLREVEVLSQLRHPHLVLLLAACPEIGCLVYEYMENGSLEERLFCKKGTPPLPWDVRFRIAYEVASGLAFLHSSKPEPIVHCDLKPGNILLDRNYVSKIGDVGLAKLISDVIPDGVTQYGDSVITGTLYYMDPEYQRTGIVRPKSDVYAFGMIVLQLLTARHPKGLIPTVENAMDNDCLVEILDKSISDWPLVETKTLALIALKCSNLRCRDRPDLESEVLPMLQPLLSIADSGTQLQKESNLAPDHYVCPILQEVMEEPYIAADGFTYEYSAIKAWLGKFSISPVTRLTLPHTMLIPNNTLLISIEEWKQRVAG
ncbi:hypothetical protein ACHQM5_029658 [Ranunculus cassubicifolius]